MKNGVSRFQERISRAPGLHLAIGLLMASLVAALDLAKPFGLSLSIFYLVPALYVGSTVPGWAAWAFQLVLAGIVFLEPALSNPALATTPHGTFNRVAGVIFGLLMVFLAWDRARVVRMLQQMNQKLEERVAARTRDLEESEGRYRNLVDTVPGAVYFFQVDAAGQRSLPFVSEGIEDLIGVSAAECVADVEAIFHRIPADAIPAIERSIRGSAEGLSPWLEEFPVQSTTGEDKWVRGHSVPFRDAKGVTRWHGVLIDITERKRAEAALRLTQFTVDRALDAIFWIGPTGKILYVNDVACRDLGYSREELLGKTVSDIDPNIPPEAWPVRWQELKQVKSRTFESCHLMKHGRTYDTEVTVNYLQFDSREYNCAMVRDITARKQAEKALRDGARYYGALFDQPAIGVAQVDSRTGRLMRVNPRYCEMLGYSSEELLRMDIQSITQADDLQENLDNLARLRGGEISTFQIEKRLLRKGGDALWVRLTVFPLWTEDAEPDFHLAFVEDIADRKRTEQSLIESEEKYGGLITEMNDGIFVTDTRGSLMFANPALAHILGFEHPDSVIGKSIFEFIVPTMANEVAGYLRQAVKSGITRESTVVEIIRQDGTNAFIEVRSKAMTACNQVTGTKGVIRDITERKRHEQELRRSEERFAKLFYASPFGILVADYPDGKIVDVNEAFLRISGFERADVIGKTTNELNVWDRPTDRLAMLERLRDGGSARNMEFVFRTKSAERRTLLISIEIIQLHGQAHSLAMLIDVSEQKLATEQMRLLRDELAHVARVGTMGELASGLAHELNQPLAAVHLYASAAQQLGAGFDSAALQNCLRHIGEQSLRAGEIVRRMRAFISRDPSRRAPADLNQLVREVLLLLENDLRQCGIALDLDLDESLFPLLVDGIQIQQVLVNLIRNAIDAMNRPEVSVRQLEIRTSATPDGARVGVADTGGGIDPAIADKLFHPFQSTKSSGLGLGLAICRTLIEAHGGCIGAVPAADGGTSFFFLIPATEARILR